MVHKLQSSISTASGHAFQRDSISRDLIRKYLAKNITQSCKTQLTPYQADRSTGVPGSYAVTQNKILQLKNCHQTSIL